MKNKFWIFGILILILAIFFLAGNYDFIEPEIVSESAQTGIVTSSKDLPVQEEKPEIQAPSEDPPNPEITESPDPNGQEESAPEEEMTCTLAVRCDAVLQNMDKLAEGKERIIPQDGTLYPEQRVEFSEGESVFDVLYREMRKQNIPFEFVKTPMYDSVYIEGIGNLYEFDCGDYSGWTYRVNGVKPTVGCSQYAVQPGDVIVVSYTCNFMKDR